MSPVADLAQIRPELFLWHHYDPSVKAELFSTALKCDFGWVLVDPIPLAVEALDELTSAHPLAGIVVTNRNHHRDSVQLAIRFSLPVFAHPDVFASPQMQNLRLLRSGDLVAADLRAIAIDGAAEGEIALYYQRDGGTMIMGDALINFEPHGFSFLPPKYCSNAKEMRRSLHQLVDFEFERMLFAHGMPLMKSARQRLEQLLSSAG